MGVVWLATDERLDRKVAVKQLLLQPGLSEADTNEARRRAMREARIAARLQHSNAIGVFDVVRHNEDPVLVMEYMPSRSLAQLLSEEQSLDPARVASMGAQVAAALAAAHSAGIVHRDIKPGNILINDEGTAKITDFGISRAVGDVTVTQTGMLAGTPAYLAPEIARGQDPSSASDVFSLGSTLYDAIEGRPPFGTASNPLALLHTVAGGEIIPPSRSGALTEVLTTVLRPDPETRPNMRALSQVLAAVAEDRPYGHLLPTTKTPVTADVRPAKPVRKGPVTAPFPALRAILPTASSAAPPAEGAPGAVTVAVRAAGSSTPDDATRTRGRNRAILVIAAIAAAAGVTTAIALTGGGDGADALSPTTVEPTVITTVVTATVTPTPDPSRQAGSEKITNHSAAGNFIVDFYSAVNNGNPADAWAMLSPAGQAQYGSPEGLANEWPQWSMRKFGDVNGVGEQGDRTLNMVIYVTKKSGETRTLTVNIGNYNGRFLINGGTKWAN